MGVDVRGEKGHRGASAAPPPPPPPPLFVAEGAAGITHGTPSAFTLLTATAGVPLTLSDVRSALFCVTLFMVTVIGPVAAPAGNY